MMRNAEEKVNLPSSAYCQLAEHDKLSAFAQRVGVFAILRFVGICDSHAIGGFNRHGDQDLHFFIVHDVGAIGMHPGFGPQLEAAHIGGKFFRRPDRRKFLDEVTSSALLLLEGHGDRKIFQIQVLGRAFVPRLNQLQPLANKIKCVSQKPLRWRPIRRR